MSLGNLENYSVHVSVNVNVPLSRPEFRLATGIVYHWSKESASGQKKIVELLAGESFLGLRKFYGSRANAGFLDLYVLMLLDLYSNPPLNLYKIQLVALGIFTNEKERDAQIKRMIGSKAWQD